MRYLLAAISGVLLALSFPNAAIEPLIFVALAPLIVALQRARSSREAFLLATFSSTITWLINVPWVIKVMSYYGGLPYPLGVLIYVAMAIYLSLYAGILFGLPVYRLRLTSSFWPWLLVPASWVALEFVRTHLLNGFPWNMVAVAIIELRPMVQLASIVGPYAVGYLIVLPSALLAWLLVTESPRSSKLAPVGGVALLYMLWVVSGLLMTGYQDRSAAAESKSIAALIQPNITQQMRWDTEKVYELFDRMTMMTDIAIRRGAAVVVWPESTVPLTYLATDHYRSYIESVSRRGNVDVILGSVAEDEGDSTRIFNAAYLVSQGRTTGRYDKIKLVPFGEFVPFRKLLFFAEKLVRTVGTFQPGLAALPLQGRFSYGPAICYEVVYPQLTKAQIARGADVLVTITNDGWFGGTSAPRQHLNMARLRAVEGDRYLLRAATTGISALVDPTGRIVESLPENTAGTIMARFAPRHTRTPYVRYGDWFAISSCIALIVGIFLRRAALR